MLLIFDALLNAMQRIGFIFLHPILMVFGYVYSFASRRVNSGIETEAKDCHKVIKVSGSLCSVSSQASNSHGGSASAANCRYNQRGRLVSIQVRTAPSVTHPLDLVSNFPQIWVQRWVPSKVF